METKKGVLANWVMESLLKLDFWILLVINEINNDNQNKEYSTYYLLCVCHGYVHHLIKVVQILNPHTNCVNQSHIIDEETEIEITLSGCDLRQVNTRQS